MTKTVIIIIVAIVITVIAFLYPSTWIKCGSRQDVDEIHSIKIAMKQYRQEYGIFPTGSVESVLASLYGNNDRKIVFLELLTDHNKFNSKGLDPWGTPYRIEIEEVIVTCAGPDHKFGTADDQTTKK